MVFERIKAHFINKKAPQTKQNWYVVEFEDDKALHIVDQKMLETMLGKNVPMSELFSCGWTENKGWHIGNDDKVYERHALNEAGLDFYERIGVAERGPKCVQILENMNNNIYPFKYDFESNGLYMNVCFYLYRNRIKSIQKYNKEELEDKTEKAVVLS